MPIVRKKAEQVLEASSQELERKDVNKLELVIKNLNEEKKDLFGQLQNLREEKDFAQSHSKCKIESPRLEVSALSEKLQQADFTELQRTQQLQDALRECNEKHSEALKTIEVFRTQVTAYDKRIEGLDASLVQARTRNADLETKMTNFPRRLRELERDLNYATKDRENKERKLKELNSKVLVLEQELSEAYLEKERLGLLVTENQSKADLQMRLRSEQIARSGAQTRCDELKKEAEDKERAIQQLIREKTVIGKEVYALKSQLSKHETIAYKKLHAGEDEARLWEKKYNALKIKLDDLEKENIALLEEKKKLNEEIKQDLMAFEEQAKEQIAAQEGKNENLLRDIEDMQNVLSERDKELVCSNEEVILLENDAENLRLDYENFPDSSGESEEVNSLRRKNENLKYLVQQLEKDVSGHLKKKELLKKENEALKTKHDLFQAKIVELEREKDSLLDKRRDLQEQTHTLQEKLSMISKQNESFVKETDYLKNKLIENGSSRSEIIVSLEHEIATIRNREARLQEEHTACKTEIVKLTNSNSLLRERLEEQANLRKETASLKGKISSLKQEQLILHKKIETLIDENNSLKTMLKEDGELHELDKRSLQKSINTLQNDVENLEKVLHKMETENESMILDRKKFNTKMAKEKENAEKEKQGFQYEIAVLQEEADKLHTEMAVVIKENDSISSERDSVIKENDNLRRLRDREASFYNQDKESLQSRIALLEKKISILQNDSCDLNRELTSLRSENENLKMLLEKERNSSKANKDNYMMEIEKIQKKMNEQKRLLTEDKTKFENELLGIKKEKEAINKEMTNLRNTLEAERTENKKTENSYRERNTLQQEKADKLQREAANITNEMNSLSIEKKELLHKKAELQKCLDDEKSLNEQRRMSWQNHTNILEKKVSTTQAELNNFMKCQSSLKQEYNDLKNKYNEERVLLVKENKKIELQLTALKGQNQKLEKELRTSKENIISIKEDFENRKREIILLEIQQSKVRTDHEKKIVTVVKEREDLEKQLLFKDQHNNEMKNDLLKLKNDLDEKNKMNNELLQENTNIKKTLAEEKAVQKSIQNEVSKLEKDIAIVTKKNDHAQLDHENQKATFQIQITTLNEELSHLQNKVYLLTEENDELKLQLVAANEEIAEQNKRLFYVKTENERHVSTCDTMQDQISNLEKELENTLQERDAMKEELKKLKEETKMDRDDEENYLLKIKSLQEKITNAQKEEELITQENEKLKDQVHNVENLIETVKKELSQVQMEKEYQMKQNSDLQRQIAAFRDQIARLNKDVLNVQKERDGFAKESQNLKGQLAVLQEQISKVNKDFANFQAETNYLVSKKEELDNVLKQERELYGRNKEAFERQITVLQNEIEKSQEKNVKPAMEEQVICEVLDTVDATPEEQEKDKLISLQNTFDEYKIGQEAKNKSLNATIAGLEAELGSLKKLKKSLCDELMAFKNSSQLKQEQLTSSNERNNQLKLELSNKEQTILDLRSKVTGITELELELSHYQEKSEELKRAEEEILSLKDVGQENEFLNQIMREIENDRDRLRREKNELQNEVDLLNEKLSRVKDLSPQLRETNEMHSEMEKSKNVVTESGNQRKHELDRSHIFVERTTFVETESAIMIKEKEVRDIREPLDTKSSECVGHLQELQDAQFMNAELKTDQEWRLRYESLKLHYKELENEKQNVEKQLQELQSKTAKPKEVEDNTDKSPEEITTVVDNVLFKDKIKAEELQKELQKVRQELLNKENIILSSSKQLRSLRLEADLKENKLNKVNEEKKQLKARIVDLENEMNKPSELIISLENQVKILRSRNQELEIEITSLQIQLETKTKTIEEICREKITLVTQITELEKTKILKDQFENTSKVVNAESFDLEHQPVLNSVKSSSINVDVKGTHGALRVDVGMGEIDSENRPKEVSNLFVPIKPVSSDVENQETKTNSQQDKKERVVVVPVVPNETSKSGDSAVIEKRRDNESDIANVERAQLTDITEKEANDKNEESPNDKNVGPLRYRFEYPKQGPTALPLVRSTPLVLYPTQILDVPPDEDPQTAIKKSSKITAENKCFVKQDESRNRLTPTQSLSKPKKQVRRANTEPVFATKEPARTKNKTDHRKVSPPIPKKEDSFCLSPTNIKLGDVNGVFKPIPKKSPQNKGTLSIEQYDVPPYPTPMSEPYRLKPRKKSTSNEDLPRSLNKISFLGSEKNEPKSLSLEELQSEDKVADRKNNFQLGGRTKSLGAILKRQVPDGYTSDSSADYYRPSASLSLKSRMQSPDLQKNRKSKKKKSLLRKSRNSEKFKTNLSEEPVMSFDI